MNWRADKMPSTMPEPWKIAMSGSFDVVEGVTQLGR
jgi:hypothetical protein